MKQLLVILFLLATSGSATAQPLPTLLQVTAPDCHACKFVHSELNKLRSLDAGRLQIETLNVVRQPTRARRLNVHMVPTLIFYDIFGREMFRHQGKWSADEIRRKWRELGLNLYSGPGA